MSKLQQLKEEINKLENSPTCPTLEEQTLLIQNIVTYVREQQVLIKNVNTSLQNLNDAFEKIDIEHDLHVDNKILGHRINYTDNIEMIFEMLFEIDFYSFLFSISMCSWNHYNQPFYKNLFRFQKFEKLKEFEKNEYQILQNIWKQTPEI